MKRFHRKRVLITGGAGFLGSHLATRMLAEGHEVLCVDNFYGGTRENIEPLRDHPNFDTIVLLRGRPDRGAGSIHGDRCRLHWPHQSGQPT